LIFLILSILILLIYRKKAVESRGRDAALRMPIAFRAVIFYNVCVNHFRVLSAVLLTLFCSCGTNEPALTVHYYRYNGDYDGWNVWAWPSDPAGNGNRFNFDLNAAADGFVTAKIFFPAGTASKIREIGMIVRKSENDNEWAEKDGSGDRFTGEKEVWLVQNDPAVYTARPELAEPPILFAAADSADTVLVGLMREPADYGVFAVYEGERRLAGHSMRAEGENSGGLFRAVIKLTETITDPAKRYTVRDASGAVAPKTVAMRRILDTFYYKGDDLGLRYSAAESRFAVWSPTAAAVSLALYDTAGEYNAAGKVTNNETSNLYPMEKDAKSGVWSVAVNGNLAGQFYLYRVTFADNEAGSKAVSEAVSPVTWAADPYTRAVSANGQRMAIVDLAKTNPPGWKPAVKPPFTGGVADGLADGAWQDAVIYELHVRDFSIDDNSGMKHKGKFLAFTERGTKNSAGVPTGLDHLVNLGVTHVHLLPAFDFASINELAVDNPASTEPKYNWGYDPMHYNVPEGSYSTDPKNPAARITEFKAMVQALHDAGIRVIMDVVYNHTYQTGGWPFDALAPGYYYRTTESGAYANGSGCGNEVASERPMARKFIIDSCKYWAREYNVDGFRFDLMGLIDTPTMQQLTEELRREVDPTLIIYGEPWQAGGSALPENLQTVTGAQRGMGFAVFNDRIRGAIKGGSDDASRGFATGADGTEAGIIHGVTGSVNDCTAQANESVNYVTAHDNLNLWDKIARSWGADDLAQSPYRLLDGKRDIFDCSAVQSVLLANGIVFTSQGIPFFQAGDEMLRSKFGDHNSYASGDRVNMIRWENAARFREVVAYYAGLIRLRREHPAFRQTRKDDIEKTVNIITAEDRRVAFVITNNANADAWRSIFVAYNAGSSPAAFTLPSGAVWQQVVDSKRAGVEPLAELSGAVTLPPLSMAVLHD
jgi:pullulanase